MMSIYTFSARFNLGLVYIPYEDYSFAEVFSRFYSEIFGIISILIHIQSQQQSGLGTENLQELETFE